MDSADDNIRNLTESLRRLGSCAFPCFVGVAGLLAATVFVCGIVFGATVHRSMLAFGTGFSMLAVVITALATDLWNVVTVVIPILDMCVMKHEPFSIILREYFASKKGAQDELMESRETAIGDVYIRLANCLYRICQNFFFLYPSLVAIVSLTCLAFGLGDDIPTSMACVYIVCLLIASAAAIVGFMTLHLKIKRALSTMLVTLIDPYLRSMLEDSESDKKASREVVDIGINDVDLESADPVASRDPESGEPAVGVK